MKIRKCHIIHHVKFYLRGYYGSGGILVLFIFSVILPKIGNFKKNSYLYFYKGLEAHILHATWCQSCLCPRQILWRFTKLFGPNIAFFKILHFFEQQVPRL